MKRLTLLFCLVSSSLFGQTIQNGFNFYLPPYDSISQQFLPQFPMHSIGSTDYVSINNGHFSVNGNRIRFWSVNVTDAAAFPDKDKASGVGGELRKHGFNLVRLHYLDQGNSDFSIFTKGQSTRQLNPTNLDKLEKLTSELKKNGVYVDMNLHVARQFNLLDGVPDADSIFEFGKGVTLFDPLLITLQKEYARNLLTHVNPYTGLALINDPVMGMVEITNENWFFLYWQSDRLKPYRLGGILTQRHNKMLEDQWNDFLIKKYGTTAALIDSWKTGTDNTVELLNNPGFENTDFSPWYLGLYDTSAKAVLTQDVVSPFENTKCAKISVQATPPQNWQLQLVQLNCSIEKNKSYTVKFAAKSSNAQKISFSVSKQTEPYTSYFSSDVQLTNQWQQFSFTFVASESRTSDVQFTFQLGGATGDFWFDATSMKQISSTGLSAGESLENKNIHRMYKSELSSYSPKRVRDLYEFFVTLQQNYYTDMYNFLKNELGVKVPISGSNYPMGVADTKIQSALDYIDVHQYWDLNWDGNSFTNTSMINNPTTSTMVGMIGQAVEGKPFTISEYNHPWPNNYQVETPFFLAGYGSYTDVDAVMLFGMSEVDAWAVDRILSEFNCGRNNVLMSCMPSFSYVYRNGLIASAKNTTTLNFSETDMYNLFQQGWTMYPDNLNKNIALTHKIRSKLNSTINFDASTLPVAPTNPYISDTDQLTWDSNGLLKINTDQFTAFVGFLNQFKNTVIGNVKIIDADKFAGVTWLSLDHQALGKSKKMLLTVGTRQQNTNMIWSSDNKKVIDKGATPTLVEPTKITLQFTIDTDSIRVVTLGTRGEKTMTRKVVKPINGNQFVVTFDQYTDHSLWYGIETEWSYDKTISIVKPEQGKELKVKSSQSIEWVGDIIGKKKIEYSDNNGKDWRPIVYDVAANLFSYNWTVSESNSDSCRIKITDLSDTSVSGISEMFSMNDNILINGGFSNGSSDWNFYINAGSQASMTIVDKASVISITNGGTASWHVQLIQPNVKIELGKTYDISFDASTNSVRNINIGIGQNGGSYISYFGQIVALSTTMKNYQYRFTMTNNTDNISRFAFDLGGANIGVNLDNIILREHKTGPSLAITSPVENETLEGNKNYTIYWTSANINKVNIYYKLTGQDSWTVIASNMNAGIGQYRWMVPSLTTRSACIIKIEDAENTATNALSNSFFIQTLTALSEVYSLSGSLSQNFPNPFSTVTRIKYTVPLMQNAKGKSGKVVIKVYNTMGVEVTTPVDEVKSAGNYEVVFNAGNLTNGIYFYKITAGSFNQTKKFIVIKNN